MAESTRRRFLSAVALAASGAQIRGAPAGRLHLATNQYPWLTFYSREGKNFNASLEAALGEIRSSSLDGYEPLVGSPAEIDRLLPLLRSHGLQMRSLYVNSILYDPARVERSMKHVCAIAEKARKAGTTIIVTNPSPIRWGGTQDKNDAQLETQARALNELGERLKDLGLTLAYHNHDIELRHAGREFHHMLVGTNPKYVSFCLDAHWIYRGSGNSSVALFDVVTLYGDRVVELHLRQSKGGVWTEAFGPGDIDYRRLARMLKEKGRRPHLVLEQAVEAATPNTMTAQQAHLKGAREARRCFRAFL